VRLRQSDRLRRERIRVPTDQLLGFKNGDHGKIMPRKRPPAIALDRL
jgi:hypothetical protein